MQAKDIPDDLVIRIVLTAGLSRWPKDQPNEYRWVFTTDVERGLAQYGIQVPNKVIHAKLRRLVQRNLLDGCTCGCRGDYYVVHPEDYEPLQDLEVELYW